MKRSLFSATILLLIILFTCCKKGDTGPQGPAGTANVIYSDWFTATAYVKDTVFGIWGFNYNKTVPEITQQILDSGSVFTFGKLVGYSTLLWPSNQVGQLPINLTYVSSGITMTDTWSGLATPGKLRIRFVNDKNYWTGIANNHQFRYIIIPGGKKGARQAKLSYEEICAMYNIPQ